MRQEGEAATGEPCREGTELDLSSGEWMINPGSVGQPRDGDPTSRMVAAGPGRVRSFLPAHHLRCRRRRRGHQGGAPAKLARGAPGVRSVNMRTLIRLAVVALLGVATALLVSCGSSGTGLIPSANAGPLQNDFEAVAQGSRIGERQLLSDRIGARQDRAGLPRAPSNRRQGLARTACRRASNTCANRRWNVRAAGGHVNFDEQQSDEQTPTTSGTTSTETTTTSTPSTTTTTPPSTQTTPTTSTPQNPGGGVEAPEEGSGEHGVGEHGAGEHGAGEHGAGETALANTVRARALAKKTPVTVRRAPVEQTRGTASERP